MSEQQNKRNCFWSSVVTQTSSLFLWKASKKRRRLVLCFVTISGWCVFSCWTNKKQRGKHENSRKKRKAVLNKKEMLTHSLAPRTPRTPRSVSSSLKRTVARRTTPVFQRKGASSEIHRLSKKNKKNYSSNKKNRCSSNNRAVLGVLREARRTTPVFQRKESFFWNKKNRVQRKQMLARGESAVQRKEEASFRPSPKPKVFSVSSFFSSLCKNKWAFWKWKKDTLCVSKEEPWVCLSKKGFTMSPKIHKLVHMA